MYRLRRKGIKTKIGLLAIWTTTQSYVVWGECHLFQIDKTAPWFIVAWTCRNLFYKEHPEYKRFVLWPPTWSFCLFGIFFSLSFLKNIWNFTPHKNSGSSSQTAAYPIYLSLAFIPVNGTFLSANLDPLINKGIKNYDKYKISAIKPITQSRITGVSGVKFPKQKKPINALSTWQNQVHRVTKRANLLIIRKYGRIQI